MNIAVSFMILSLLYCFSLAIIYFKKSHIENNETKLFSIMLVLNLLGLILELSCYFIVKADFLFLANIVNRAYLIYLYLFIAMFNVYTLYLFYRMKMQDNKNEDTFFKKVFNLSLIIFSLFCAISLCFPIEFVNEGNHVYSRGFGINILIFVAFIASSFWTILAIMNIRKIFNRKCVPFLAFICLSVVVTLLQQRYPWLTLTTVVETFIVFLMYHTIENPDVQIINLLMRNRELVEESVNDKSNFLFKISQDLKKPVQNVIKDIKELKNSSIEEDRKNLIESIEDSANRAYFIINDVTNISSMDVKSFKVQGDTYMTDRFLADINANVKNRLKIEGKDQKIKFNFKANTSYPESLYGDNIKLKQVLLSLINNSIKYTKEGFIELELDALTRYDACRLIFTISDSGCGMPINKVNELLSVNEEINDINFQKTDDLNLRIPVINKMLKLLDGNMNINSKEGSGTIITVVINQEVNYDSTNLVLNNTKKYDVGIHSKSKVLIADDTSLLDKMERLVSKYDVDIVTTLLGKDVIDKIKSGDNYDLIIMRDDMKPDNAFTILKELQKNKKFKTPVVIGISKEKEFIKEHFIEDGFSDYIMLENIDNEIPRICDKYI